MNDYNKAIALIIPLIVKNNPGKVALALRDAGYSKNFIPQGELEAKLFQIHTVDPNKFFVLMSNIPWNYGEVENNKPEIRDRLIELSGMKDSAETRGDWWKALLGLLQGQSNPPPSAPQPAKSMWPLLALAIVGIAIVVAVIFIIRSL